MIAIAWPLKKMIQFNCFKTDWLPSPRRWLHVVLSSLIATIFVSSAASGQSLLDLMDNGANDQSTGQEANPHAVQNAEQNAGQKTREKTQAGEVVSEVATEANPEVDDNLRPMMIKRGRRAVEAIEFRKVVLSGESVLTIHAEEKAISNSQVHFDSEDAWVHFKNIRPQTVADDYLSQFFVDGEPAVIGENMRIAQIEDGTYVIPHGLDYQALQTYNQVRYAGASRSYVPYTYYKSELLADHEDAIVSFVLKKGYMATFAENEDGTGASQVFIAHDRDLKVPRLPKPLLEKVSFIRVFPWNWVGKKGFDGGEKATGQLEGYWRYDWGAGGQSTLNIEYVPMRHNRWWDGFEKINRKQNATHVLGFNEPMQKDQADMSVKDALDLWPRLLESGLRLGSPAPTDGGLNWLYEFLDGCKERGYRVDFVAVHFYKGNWSTEQLMRWLNQIHRRTGLPLWVTEFNNGADWSRNHNPTYEQNARQVESYCKAMEAASFIERYAVFNLGNPKYQRAIFRDGELTPAGQRYRALRSKQAYTGATGGRRR